MSTRVEFRAVMCSGKIEHGHEQYDSDSGFGYGGDFYRECTECGRREYSDYIGRSWLRTPHEKAMPGWTTYSGLRPNEQDDEDRTWWWAAVAEVAALCGEELGITVIRTAEVK